MSGPRAEAELWERRGLAAQSEGRFREGRVAYSRAIAMDPARLASHVGRAQCALEMGDRAAALEDFRRALALAPRSGALRHMVDALSGEGFLPRAPDDYLTWVFDGSAAQFDAHLAALNYQGPQMACDLAGQVIGPPGPTPALKILDLGCGTGLNAPLFKPYATRLDGVDLAANMLAQADRRGLYDNLYQAEVHAFLQRLPVAYNLILATDVLIYIGEFRDLFMACRQALEPGGWLLVTIELAETGPPVQLMPSGRYRQSDDYVLETGSTAGFVLAGQLSRPLRIEGGRPEPGRAYVFRVPK